MGSSRSERAQQRKQQLKKKALLDLRRIVLILVAATIAAFNINAFVDAGGLYPGGATGLTILIQRVFTVYFHLHIPYTVINVLLNAIPFYVGYRYVGTRFAFHSLLMIMSTNLLVDILPHVPITYDILLISIFGGLINGVLMSLCLYQNACTGGTDFIAIWLSEKKGVDTFNTILLVNGAILLAAGFIFGWDKALYSIIFQFVSTQVLHLFYQRYQQLTLLIVTEHPYEVVELIRRISNHGSTMIPGLGTYEGREKTVLYSVINRSAKNKILKGIQEVDPHAFVDVLRTEELSGYFYYKPQE